jgi:hypothetical protein
MRRFSHPADCSFCAPAAVTGRPSEPTGMKLTGRTIGSLATREPFRDFLGGLPAADSRFASGLIRWSESFSTGFEATAALVSNDPLQKS